MVAPIFRPRLSTGQALLLGSVIRSGVWCQLGTWGFAAALHTLDGIRIVKVFLLTVCFTFIVKTLTWFTGIRVWGLSPTQTVG